MDDLEMNEAPEESVSEPEETSSESGPTPEPEESVPDSEPEEPMPEPEEPAPDPEELPADPEPEAPQEMPGELEPEAPTSEPVESGAVSGETVQDLIGAIDDLNETITGAVAEPEPEQLPAEEGEGSGSGGGEEVVVTPSVDLAPVVKVLERTTELLEQQNEISTTQHNDLLQVQANLDFVFLAVCMLAGVVVGCFVGCVFHDLWRA